MTATGWCEDCGDVEVEPMCQMIHGFDTPALLLPWSTTVLPQCCHYADCPKCGNDVDQWAWA